MSELKQWHFFDKVYRRWVVLFIGPLEGLKEELERSEFKDMDEITLAKGYTITLTPENSIHNCMLVWLEKYEASTLVHELSHLVMACFEKVGVPISNENTEAFAFYQEYWWTEIQKARRKWPAGNKPKDAR